MRLSALFPERVALRKPKKPPDIQYGVDDAPPLPATVLSACQHVGSLSISMVVPVLILHGAHLPPELAGGMIGLSFLGLAVACIVQALPRGPVGSGYLAPSACTGLFLVPCIQAATLGGLPLMFGMTAFAGAVQAALSRLVRHLRPFLPPEIAGAVTFLLGINGGMTGLRALLGLELHGTVPGAHWFVAVLTLLVIVGLNVWGRGLLRMSCVLIGMIVGYAAAIATGLVPAAVLSGNGAPLLALPQFQHPGFDFDVTLVVPFVLAALVASIKAIAVVSACQRLNDANYVRPDLASINRGVLADGLNTMLSAGMGAAPFNAASSSPGLAAATGVTSRRVAYAIAALFTVLAFSPAAAGLFSAMPDAVIGAILVFGSCFVVTSGVEIMASRLLDSRRMLVVASAILAAEGTQSVAAYAGSLPVSLQPLVASPLLLGTVVALLLNLVFRPGLRRNSTLDVDPQALDADQIHGFMDARGAAWGARPDVIQRASFALAELIESVARSCEPAGPIHIGTSFDEFRVVLRVSYHGKPMPFPATRPSLDDIAESDDGLLRLSGFLVRRQTDGVRATHRGELSLVELQFEH